MLHSAPPSPLKGPVHQDGGRRGRGEGADYPTWLPLFAIMRGTLSFLHSSPVEESPNQTSVERLSINLEKKVFRGHLKASFFAMHFLPKILLFLSWTPVETSHTTNFQFKSTLTKHKLKFDAMNYIIQNWLHATAR